MLTKHKKSTFFLFSCFTTNTPESSGNYKILIISSVSSFKIKWILWLLLPLIFLSNIFVAFKAAFNTTIVTNFGRTSLAKGIAEFISAFFWLIYYITKKSTQLNYFSQMSFTKFYICQHVVSKGSSYFSFLSFC